MSVFMVDRDQYGAFFQDVLLCQVSGQHFLGFSDGGCGEVGVENLQVLGSFGLSLQEFDVVINDLIVQPVAILESPHGFIGKFLARFILSPLDFLGGFVISFRIEPNVLDPLIILKPNQRIILSLPMIFQTPKLSDVLLVAIHILQPNGLQFLHRDAGFHLIRIFDFYLPLQFIKPFLHLLQLVHGVMEVSQFRYDVIGLLCFGWGLGFLFLQGDDSQLHLLFFAVND